ncbi:MAG: biosynthetic-type acetolactate synthase large subunit [Deltaproteobacteria bacterium]|nr:biosynthetic-type acetolactate synthase large subunit [Deltaproteobacteria bacterium]
MPDRLGQRLTGAQLIWEALAREGVDVVFGYPGGAIMPGYDAMIDYPIHHVLVRHEQGAAHMADGYARASGRVGVCVATSGPGATNLVTGIATAMLDSIPMVAITGQVSSTLIGSDAFQEVDITGITLPITKHNYLVTRAEDIVPTIREAFYIARSGRPGPVHVDICKDAQQARAELRWSDTPPTLPGYRPSYIPLAKDLERALELIHAAKRPVILAGQGILKSNASDVLMQLVDATGIPVALTLLGLGGFPASHPLSLGMMGMHGEAWVNHAIQESDLLIALGMRFDDRVTGRLATYAPGAKKIHVELDPSEINKNVKVDVALVGDVRTVLQALVPHAKKTDRAPWLARIDQMKGDSAVRDIQSLPDSGVLYAAHVIHDLWRATQGKALVVTDVGQHQMWEAQYYKHEEPRSLITSGGLGTMGFALPAAIGAKLARKDASVWVVVGDGGFQMTACELTTCAQENVKVNVAIINNGFLGMVRQWQEFFYGGRYAATPIRSPDFVKLAEAHGLAARRVTQRSEVVDAVRWAEAEPGTVVIDFRVAQEDSVYPMVPAGADLHDMIRRTKKEPPKAEDAEAGFAAANHNPIFETGEDG